MYPTEVYATRQRSFRCPAAIPLRDERARQFRYRKLLSTYAVSEKKQLLTKDIRSRTQLTVQDTVNNLLWSYNSAVRAPGF